jgi:hypothetical protein
MITYMHWKVEPKKDAIPYNAENIIPAEANLWNVLLGNMR